MIVANMKAIGTPTIIQANANKNPSVNRMMINIEAQNVNPINNRTPSIAS